MKKILALFLSALLLCGFGLAAGAEMTEEIVTQELVIQDLTRDELRACFMQTMEDFKEEYTIEGYVFGWFPSSQYYQYTKIIHSDGNYAFVREDGVRDVFLEDRILRVYPGLLGGTYQEMPLSHGAEVLRLLEAKEIPEDAYVGMEGGFMGYWVYYDNLRYFYGANGDLEQVDAHSYIGRPGITVFAFNKGADHSVFNIEGLQKASALQMRWMDGSVLRFWLKHFQANPWQIPFIIPGILFAIFYTLFL